MRQRFTAIAAAVCAMAIVGCSNLYNELQLQEPFHSQSKVITPAQDCSLEELKDVDATSANEGIVTATVNDDGTVTLTSKALGTTTVTVIGTDPENDTEYLAIVYDVTVSKDGSITAKAREPARTKLIEPKKAVDDVTTNDAKSGDENVATVIQKDDGTVLVVAQWQGTEPRTTTVTVEGTNTKGEAVTITYEVTVAAAGTITVGTPKVFTNTSMPIDPTTSGKEFKDTKDAFSADKSIATATVEKDGTIKVTAQKEGTTSVTVRGTKENGDPITLVYPVTVSETGEITVGEPTELKNETKTIDPKNDVTGFVTETATTTDHDGTFITDKQNDDGTVTVTSQGAGTTTETITGKDADGDVMTLTYPVTVEGSGAITVGRPLMEFEVDILFPLDFALEDGGAAQETAR